MAIFGQHTICKCNHCWQIHPAKETVWMRHSTSHVFSKWMAFDVTCALELAQDEPGAWQSVIPPHRLRNLTEGIPMVVEADA